MRLNLTFAETQIDCLLGLSVGSIIVHVQLERARKYYDIEGLHSKPDSSNIRRIPNKEVVSTGTIHTLDTLE